MAATVDDDERLKDLMKSALIEVLQEHRELLREIVEEAIEEIALARAIEEGLDSESATRDEVFAILGDAK